MGEINPNERSIEQRHHREMKATSGESPLLASHGPDPQDSSTVECVGDQYAHQGGDDDDGQGAHGVHHYIIGEVSEQACFRKGLGCRSGVGRWERKRESRGLSCGCRMRGELVIPEGSGHF